MSAGEGGGGLAKGLWYYISLYSKLADRGGRGVKNWQNLADIVYGRPLLVHRHIRSWAQIMTLKISKNARFWAILGHGQLHVFQIFNFCQISMIVYKGGWVKNLYKNFHGLWTSKQSLFGTFRVYPNFTTLYLLKKALSNRLHKGASQSSVQCSKRVGLYSGIDWAFSQLSFFGDFGGLNWGDRPWPFFCDTYYHIL